MDKVRLDFFDIVGYLVPGSALLFSLWVTADPTVKSLMDLHAFIGKIDSKTLLACLMGAYILGFTLHYFGGLLFRWSLKTSRKIPEKQLPEYWTLIREHGSSHLGILERWSAFKALSSNLGAYSLLASVLSVIKLICTKNMEWILVSVAFLGLYWIYRQKALIYHSFLDKDSYAVFDALNLKEKFPPHLQPKD